MTSSISPLPRTINFDPHIKWTASQEKNINEYPFTDSNNEAPEQFVVRTYLQFLWLPESLMPLDLLVLSLRRVQVASTSTDSLTSPHPLHALLDPLLLTARTAANKYQVELPRILDNNGGAGEIEETMMWFALSFEKAHEGPPEHERTRTNTGSSVSSTQSSEAPIWMDEKWRARWIRRMERREVQIQILLHLIILSLPGPLPPPPPEYPELSSVKRRKRPRKKTARIATPADRLEAFMDKLSMWQLMGDLDLNETNRAAAKIRNELDWTQLFCQNIVEPLFRSTLPDMCELLRSKVFPNSPFSNDENERQEAIYNSQPGSSSPPPEPPLKRTRTAKIDETPDQQIRYSSPALSTTSTSSSRELKRAPSNQDPRQRHEVRRDRSRSLSVSLAEEAEKKHKAKNTGLGANKGRVLSREVSMSFKSKSKASDRTNASAATSFLLSDTRQREAEKRAIKREPSMNEAVTVLVEATPMKPIRTVSMSQTQMQDPALTTTLFPRALSMLSAVGEEEIWDLPGSSSPDILLLTPTGTGSTRSAEEEDSAHGLEGNWVLSTPTKAGRRRATIKPRSP